MRTVVLHVIGESLDTSGVEPVQEQGTAAMIDFASYPNSPYRSMCIESRRQTVARTIERVNIRQCESRLDVLLEQVPG